MSTTASPLPRLLKAEEVAAQLQMPRWRLYELSRADLIPTVRIGPRSLRYDARAVAEWIRGGGSNGNGNVGDAERRGA